MNRIIKETRISFSFEVKWKVVILSMDGFLIFNF